MGGGVRCAGPWVPVGQGVQDGRLHFGFPAWETKQSPWSWKPEPLPCPPPCLCGPGVLACEAEVVEPLSGTT